jgi:hypothetical protein
MGEIERCIWSNSHIVSRRSLGRLVATVHDRIPMNEDAIVSNFVVSDETSRDAGQHDTAPRSLSS